jgi:hypothetical protein
LHPGRLSDFQIVKALSYRLPAGPDGGFAAWLAELGAVSGVYVIRARLSGRILYVGESHTGSLGKTIKRHFWPWSDDPERRHHVYDRDSVEVAIRVGPAGIAVKAQNKLIRRLNPRDNGNGYGEALEAKPAPKSRSRSKNSESWPLASVIDVPF